MHRILAKQLSKDASATVQKNTGKAAQKQSTLGRE